MTMGNDIEIMTPKNQVLLALGFREISIALGSGAPTQQKSNKSKLRGMKEWDGVISCVGIYLMKRHATTSWCISLVPGTHHMGIIIDLKKVLLLHTLVTHYIGIVWNQLHIVFFPVNHNCHTYKYKLSIITRCSNDHTFWENPGIFAWSFFCSQD